MDSLVSSLAVCVWIPQFALRVEEQRNPALRMQPTAILAATDTHRVEHVSKLARRFGVKPGMTVSQAIGLCTSLVLLEADPVYYDLQFTKAIQRLSRVSPVIEPVELGRVFIGVDGLERLYGNPEKQIAAIREHLFNTRVHHPAVPLLSRHPTIPHVRLGYARGKFVAWVAARSAAPAGHVLVTEEERAEFLKRQSIATLPLEVETCRKLWLLGIKTLGELARLPEQALVSQFGAEGRMALQLARGELSEPVVGQPAPRPIMTRISFPAPLADAAMLDHAIRILIRRALRHPRRIGWRVQAVRVHAELEQGASWMVEAKLKDPAADIESIAAPLGAKLSAAPPKGAVEQLQLEFTAFVRGTAELQLFARDASSSARAGRKRALRWAAREIKTRLRRSMLYHVIEVNPDSRIPERRYALVDFGM